MVKLYLMNRMGRYEQESLIWQEIKLRRVWAE